MALENQGFPSYSFVMFLAFAAFGSYLWSSDPLKTARPLTQNSAALSSSRLNTVPARLWQDPFRIIYLRNRNNKPLAIKKLESTGLVEKIKKYLSDNKVQELLVLGVMVSTEAIADAEERRRRRRYAVINALSEAGYVPEDARHIQVGDMNGWDKQAARLIMPYEWFRRDALMPVASEAGGEDAVDADERPAKRQKKILLLWLDASHYHAAPYLHLQQLVQKLAPDENIRRKMRYAILGPAVSGGLSALVKQADQAGVSELCRLQTAGIHILSPLATIADSLLYPNMEFNQWLDQRFSFDKFDTTAGQCLSFKRTIHSDDQLMFRLVMELSNRGVAVGKNHVVLLSERDTAFGRALPESFAQAYCGCYDAVCKKNYIHIFSYLRGIDGVAPGSNADLGLTTSKSSASKTRDRQQRSASSIRRPVGSGQFDYLRRVADEIVLLDKKLRKQDGKGILAIGVLGSDVYDKLLILRALHSRLMGVTFFTTDLDAQYLHPSEYPWTRNLLIASSFDLKLTPELQGSTPPFRDSYQTSIFYAAGLALQLAPKISQLQAFRDRLELPTRLKPLLFEIGRNGVVPLQPLKEENDHYAQDVCAIRQSAHDSPPDMKQIPRSKLHPTGAERELFLPLLLTIAIIGLALLALKQLNAQAKYQLRWLGAGMLVLAGISAIGIWCSLTEEPFLLLAGVSVWPTEIINSLTLVLSLYFICTSLRALKLNYDAMSDKYYLLGWAESLSEKHKAGNEESTEGQGWKVIFILMLLVSTLLVILLPRTIRYNDILWMLLIWGGVLGIWSLLINRVTPVASLNKWAAQIKQQNDVPIQQYWKSYGEYGSLRNRFLRAFTVVLIFQAFVSFVFTLFGLEPPPLRGEVTRIVDSLITVGSVLGMLFLLFYMVDATRLCIVWMRGLIENSYDWRGSAVEELAGRMNIPWPCAVHWLKLQMVAERSGEVGKLIYYPFIVIILILFSRINYFDDWGFPQSLAIITSSLIAIALYAAIKLRQVAEKLRSDFIDYLNQEKIAVSGNKSLPNKPSLAQLEELISDVRRLRTGAFQPFLEQPLVKASLLLLGGVGFSASQFSALL